MSNLLIEVGVENFPIHYFGLAKRCLAEEYTKEFYFNGLSFDHMNVDSRKNKLLIYISKIVRNESVRIIKDYHEAIKVSILNALRSINMPIYSENLENPGDLSSYIQWIQAVLDGELLPVNERFFTDKNTEFLAKKDHFNVYEKDIKDTQTRINDIYLKIKRLAREKGLEVPLNSFLIEDYINQYEEVIPFISRFDNKYLTLNQQMIEAILYQDFKYLPVYNEDVITEYFIGFSEHEFSDQNNIELELVEAIVNDRFEEVESLISNTTRSDIKDLVPKLIDLPYLENFGNYYERTNRIVEISEHLAKILDVGDTTVENVHEIAYLSKADKMTKIVQSIPSLHGTVGMFLAEESGYNSIISSGILECRMPKFSKDILPRSTASKIVSIANRIEYMISTLIIHQLEYSSLFDLREEVIGLIDIIIESKWILDLRKFLNTCIYIFIKNDIIVDHVVVNDLLLKYINVVLRDELIKNKFDFYIIDGVMFHDMHDIYDIYKRVKSVSEISRHTNREILYLAKRLNQYCNTHKDELALVDYKEDEKYLYFNKLYTQQQYSLLLKELWLLKDVLESYMDEEMNIKNLIFIDICTKAFNNIFNIDDIFI